MYVFIKKYKICNFELNCFKKNLFELDPNIYMTRRQLNKILGHKRTRKGLYTLEYWYKDLFNKFKLKENVRASELGFKSNKIISLYNIDGIYTITKISDKKSAQDLAARIDGAFFVPYALKEAIENAKHEKNKSDKERWSRYNYK